MKIEYKDNDTPKIKSIDIPVGTVFTGIIGTSVIGRGLFLKAYQITVDLDYPNRTWVDDRYNGHLVRNYCVVEAKVVVE